MLLYFQMVCVHDLCIARRNRLFQISICSDTWLNWFICSCFLVSAGDLLVPVCVYVCVGIKLCYSDEDFWVHLMI